MLVNIALAAGNYILAMLVIVVWTVWSLYVSSLITVT